MTLEQWRLKNGLTYDALAERLGIEGVNRQRTAARYAHGENIPNRSLIRQIERITGGAVRDRDWLERPIRRSA